jgi:peptide-methionine (S)-S-oxide reductase
VEFDPSVISYAKLLEVFWASHDPRERPWKRQYMSAIIPRNDDQRTVAIWSRKREAARRNGRIYTEILPSAGFHPAEEYHQKYMLRGNTELMKEYEAMFPSFADFLASTAVTRVNGYVAGNGTCDSLRKELDGLGLSPAGRKRLEDILCTHGEKKGRSVGAACPTG